MLTVIAINAIINAPTNEIDFKLLKKQISNFFWISANISLTFQTYPLHLIQTSLPALQLSLGELLVTMEMFDEVHDSQSTKKKRFYLSIRNSEILDSDKSDNLNIAFVYGVMVPSC